MSLHGLLLFMLMLPDFEVDNQFNTNLRLLDISYPYDSKTDHQIIKPISNPAVKSMAPQKNLKETNSQKIQEIDDQNKDQNNSWAVPSTESNVGESDLESISSGSVQGTEAEMYLEELRVQVSRNQVYPALSVTFKEEGLVKLLLTVKNDGTVQKIEIVQYSDHKRLNEAALRTVTKAFPFKPFPSSLKIKIWKIKLPLRFVLASR
jgi:TonB family protein